MNYKAYGPRLKICAVALALTASVSLTACSPSLGEIQLWANDQPADAPTPQKVAAVAELPAAPRILPDMPPNLVKCIDKKPKTGKSADEKVVNLKQNADERRACMKAMLDFYRKIQKAEKEKKRSASADPPLKPLSP